MIQLYDIVCGKTLAPSTSCNTHLVKFSQVSAVVVGRLRRRRILQGSMANTASTAAYQSARAHTGDLVICHIN